MDCKHPRGVDAQNFCRMCGEPVDGSLAKKRKMRSQKMAQIYALLHSPFKVSEKDRAYWEAELLRLNEMQL